MSYSFYSNKINLKCLSKYVSSLTIYVNKKNTKITKYLLYFNFFILLLEKIVICC